MHYRIEVVTIQKVSTEYIVTADSKEDAIKAYMNGDTDEVSGEEILEVLEEDDPVITGEF